MVLSATISSYLHQKYIQLWYFGTLNLLHPWVKYSQLWGFDTHIASNNKGSSKNRITILLTNRIASHRKYSGLVSVGKYRYTRIFYTGWFLMSDGSIFCTDQRDILAKCYVYFQLSIPRSSFFDLIFILFHVGLGPQLNNYVIRKLKNIS